MTSDKLGKLTAGKFFVTVSIDVPADSPEDAIVISSYLVGNKLMDYKARSQRGEALECLLGDAVEIVKKREAEKDGAQDGNQAAMAIDITNEPPVTAEGVAAVMTARAMARS